MNVAFRPQNFWITKVLSIKYKEKSETMKREFWDRKH